MSDVASAVVLLVAASSIWVFVDAKAIGARKIPGRGVLSMWPHEWFISCLLLWVVAFPVYLGMRSQIKADGQK